MNSFSLTQKFSAFYVNRNLMTVCTTNKNLSLCRVRWIESKNSHPIPLRPLSILSSSKSLILPNKAFPRYNPLYISRLPHTCHMPRPSHLSSFKHSNNIRFGMKYKSWRYSLCSFLKPPVSSSLLAPNVFLSNLFPSILSKIHYHTKYEVKSQSTLKFIFLKCKSEDRIFWNEWYRLHQKLIFS